MKSPKWKGKSLKTSIYNQQYNEMMMVLFTAVELHQCDWFWIANRLIHWHLTHSNGCNCLNEINSFGLQHNAICLFMQTKNKPLAIFKLLIALPCLWASAIKPNEIGKTSLTLLFVWRWFYGNFDCKSKMRFIRNNVEHIEFVHNVFLLHTGTLTVQPSPIFDSAATASSTNRFNSVSAETQNNNRKNETLTRPSTIKTSLRWNYAMLFN